MVVFGRVEFIALNWSRISSKFELVAPEFYYFKHELNGLRAQRELKI